MNDFTKDELIDLSVVLNVWCDRYPGDKITCELRDKIKFMIDNYKEEVSE